MSFALANCARCGHDQFDTTRAIHDSRLIGGVTAALCSRCITEWDEVCRESPEWKLQQELKVDEQLIGLLASAGRETSREDVAAIAERNAAIHKAFHVLAKEFVNTRPDWANAV